MKKITKVALVKNYVTVRTLVLSAIAITSLIYALWKGCTELGFAIFYGAGILAFVSIIVGKSDKNTEEELQKKQS